jgi:hypothetical protein
VRNLEVKIGSREAAGPTKVEWDVSIVCEDPHADVHGCDPHLETAIANAIKILLQSVVFQR